jgi:hypothetical protein
MLGVWLSNRPFTYSITLPATWISIKIGTGNESYEMNLILIPFLFTVGKHSSVAD